MSVEFAQIETTQNLYTIYKIFEFNLYDIRIQFVRNLYRIHKKLVYDL